MTDAAGTIIPNSQAAYLPFGDWRNEPTTSDLTDVGYTGHRHNNTATNDLGLIYMNARYYLLGTGRFASADTIVPDPANLQSFNRFSYVYNNPLKLTDPSGHCAENDDGCWEYLECESSLECFCDDGLCNNNDWSRWIILNGDSIWTIGELSKVREALLAVKSALQNAGYDWLEIVGDSWRFERFNSGRLPTNFDRTKPNDNGFQLAFRDGRIGLSDQAFERKGELIRSLVHEIGHAVNWHYDYAMSEAFHREAGIDFVLRGGEIVWQTPEGYYWRAYGRNDPEEAFADAFAVFVLGAPSTSSVANYNQAQWEANMSGAVIIAIDEVISP